MRRFRRIILAVGTVAYGLVAAESASAYCAVCQTALANSPEGQQLAGGLNSGILFLFSAPFLVAGGMLFLIFRGQLRAALRRWLGSIQSNLRPGRSSFLLPEEKPHCLRVFWTVGVWGRAVRVKPAMFVAAIFKGFL